MSEPKKHHYVPQSSQKLFWDASRRQIAELDLSSGKSDWFNPKSRCYEMHLYRTDQAYQELSKTHLENPLLSGIDERYPKAVNALKFGDAQSVDRMVIATYVAFLRFRNPWALDAVEDCTSDAVKRALYVQIAARKIAVLPGLNLRVSSIDAFLEDLDRIEITGGKDGGLMGMLGLSLDFVAEMLEYKWRLFYSPAGGFITSDKPVSSVAAETDDGLLQYFLIPLSSHWMLQAGQGADDEIAFCEAGNAEVEEGNLAVACCADKRILGASEVQLKKLYDLRIAEMKT